MVLEKTAADQVIRWARIDPNDDIVTLLHGIDEAIFGRHLKSNLGMGRRKRGRKSAHGDIAEEHRHIDAQPPPRSGQSTSDSFAGLGDIAQWPLRLGLKGAALLGQAQ